MSKLQPSSPTREPESSGTTYFAQDTIVAIATASGGAIGIIRLSGPRALALVQSLRAEPQDPTPRRLQRCALRDPRSGRALDDALLAHFPGPNSYTGEDVVEVHMHGSGLVASGVLEALLDQGARQALPGEFSFRAVRNGKLTLGQAQAVSDLITATSTAGTELALEKLSGSQNRWLAQLGEELRRIAMLAEAGIDFSDQDIDEVR